jgi:hypothetical protein
VRSLLALVLPALLVALFVVSAVPALPTAAGAPSPRIGSGIPSHLASPVAPTATAGPSAVRAAAAMPAVQPSSGNCPTPTGTPIWNSPNFFSDAVVTFFDPGVPSLSGSNFQTVPCDNTVATYTNGFWMNVTTNVRLTAANVTIWGTTWPTPGNSVPDLPSFPQATPRVMPMNLNPPYYHTASFFFNVYRFFWPGSQVYFNVSLTTASATPSNIRSTESSHIDPIPIPGGGFNNATWMFFVADPWGTGQPGSENFTQDIQVSTSPSVLSTPAFEPNFKQQLQIFLTAINPLGGPPVPIPMAQGTFTLTGPVNPGVYYQNFGPVNHTVMSLAQPLGPYPGDKVQFNITAWLPWELSTNGLLGAIDRIYSPIFAFNWSANGGWWYPTYDLLANAQLSSLPDVTSVPTSTTVLSTGTPVNVTVHSPIENVTISTASITYDYRDANGFSKGTLGMTGATRNTSYAIFPGLPPGGTLTFSVTAKDVFGNPVSTGNYTYTEAGTTASALPGGYGLFYVEGLDLSTGALVKNVNFTVANNTWSEKGTGTTYGFLSPVPLGGVGYLPVAYGAYSVTLTAFGTTQTDTFAVSTGTPFTVVFFFASAPVSPTTSVNLSTAVTIPSIVGLVGATAVMWPVVSWFRERRKKAEAEQRRITL